VDRCLRVQILAAHLSALPGIGLEMDQDEYSTGQCLATDFARELSLFNRV
jgi:hypothetical protein